MSDQKQGQIDFSQYSGQSGQQQQSPQPQIDFTKYTQNQQQGDWRDTIVHAFDPDQGNHPIKNFLLGVGQGVVTPILHPIQAFESNQPTSGGNGYPGMTYTGYKPADQANAATLDQRTQDAQRFSQQMSQKFKAEPSHTIGTLIAPLVTAKAISSFLSTPVEGGTLGDVVSAQEKAARGFTKAINPEAPEYRTYIQNVQNEGGNIVDYAQRTGNQLRNPLEWAKAARGAAQERQAIFNDKFLGPIADQTETVPRSFQGRTIGEGGTQATLGDISARLGKINDMLRSAYGKKEGGLSREALANEADLEAERKSLSDILNNGIAKRTGVTPEQVGQLRQSYGRMYDVADKTEGAINRRAASEETRLEGREQGLGTKRGLLSQGIYRLRGRSEGIAARQYRRALPDVQDNIDATETPEANPPAPTPSTRTPAWQGIQPTQPPTADATPNPADLEAQQATQAKRLSDRQARQKLAADMKAQAQQEVIKNQQSTQESQAAAQSRATAADLVRRARLAARRPNMPPRDQSAIASELQGYMGTRDFANLPEDVRSGLMQSYFAITGKK